MTDRENQTAGIEAAAKENHHEKTACGNTGMDNLRSGYSRDGQRNVGDDRNAALIEQIDALLAIDAKGQLSTPIGGIARELLVKSQAAITAYLAAEPQSEPVGAVQGVLERSEAYYRDWLANKGPEEAIPLRPALVAEPQQPVELVAWGRIEKGRDGKLAIYSTKFNVRKATLSPGAATGLSVGDTVYLYTTPTSQADLINRLVTDETVERACRVYNVGWSKWHEPQKKTAREVMRSALTAAISQATEAGYISNASGEGG